MTVNINAGDVFVEVIGTPNLSAIERLPEVKSACVWPYARLGDATLQLTLKPGAPLRVLLEEMRSLGLTILAGRRAEPPRIPIEARAAVNQRPEPIPLLPRLLV